MKARPILFSGPMVRALLDGRKHQTRRIIKPQPDLATNQWTSEEVNAAWQDGFIPVPCPYGKPGDLLWVRESWRPQNDAEIYYCVEYRADNSRIKPEIKDENMGFRFECQCDAAERGENNPWKPSIHMPRWASRLTLEITDVRVQRLQDISEEDAGAEGTLECDGMFDDVQYCHYCKEMGCVFGDLKPSFRQLWQSLNGPGSWDANPWVWALSFRVHQQNVDHLLKERSV